MRYSSLLLFALFAVLAVNTSLADKKHERATRKVDGVRTHLTYHSAYEGACLGAAGSGIRPRGRLS